MHKRVGELTAATALSATLLSGCSVFDREYEPIAPDGSLEQVQHTMRMTDELGELVLQQELRLPGNGNEPISIYNYGAAPLDPADLNTTVNYLEDLASRDITHTFTLGDGTQSLQFTAVESNRKALQHDLLILPEDIGMPESVTERWPDDFYTTGVTQVRPTQTISVVLQQEDLSGIPIDPLRMTSLPVELCQSLVQVELESEPSSSMGDPERLEIIAQEAVCNGVGSALQAATTGISYGVFDQFERNFEGQVALGDDIVTLAPYIVERTEYEAMQQAFSL